MRMLPLFFFLFLSFSHSFLFPPLSPSYSDPRGVEEEGEVKNEEMKSVLTIDLI